MSNLKLIDKRLEDLSKSNFRSKFHLNEREKSIALTKGIPIIQEHAREIISRRLADAEPKNDGKQTPFKGYPVFIAQHATATCCRSCLEKWHKIPKGHKLTESEIGYICEIISKWIEKEI